MDAVSDLKLKVETALRYERMAAIRLESAIATFEGPAEVKRCRARLKAARQKLRLAQARLASAEEVKKDT
jgi:exonuclease VII small subunit